MEVTGPGYLTVTVTPETLAAVADAVTAAGPACVTSDALAGETVPAAPPADPLAAPTWEKARTALAARLTARLAAAAGATVADFVARTESAYSPAPPVFGGSARPGSKQHSFGRLNRGTGRQAAAARDGSGGGRRLRGPRRGHVYPGQGRPGQAIADRPGNNSEARARQSRLCCQICARPRRVRGALGSYFPGGRPPYPSAAGDTGVPRGRRRPCRPPATGELALLDALSWLPERVASAARRGRPDEFARYLEDLASVTVDVLSSASHPGSGPR